MAAKSPNSLPERVRLILAKLKRTYPDAHCELHHSNPLQLLIATILSAQCTDERVNKVTPALFARCRTAHDFAHIPTAELEGLIRTTGFFRSKAKSIRGCAASLVKDHKGEVPKTMEHLHKLPGVGRKPPMWCSGTLSIWPRALSWTPMWAVCRAGWASPGSMIP